MGYSRAAFVDVPCVHHFTHDFTEPDLSAYFLADEGEIRKEDVLYLANMTQYTIYWVELSDSSLVNDNLHKLIGMYFPLKIMVFRRRVRSMRFGMLTRDHLRLSRAVIKR